MFPICYPKQFAERPSKMMLGNYQGNNCQIPFKFSENLAIGKHYLIGTYL